MKALRAYILIAHRWVGLTVGVFFMAVALTGLGMVFRPQIEPRLDAELRQAAPCSQPVNLDGLADRALESHPQGILRQVELRPGSGSTLFRYTDDIGVYIDPCNGRVLGQADRWGGLFGTIEYVHRFRYLKNVDLSETVAGSFSLVLAVVMALGGLLMWWPTTRRQWKGAWKLRWSLKGAAFEINLHRTYGAYAALVILATTLASLTFVFDWARGTVYAVTASSPPAKKPRSAVEAGTVAPLQQFLDGTLATAPAAGAITLVLPRKKGDAVEAIVIDRDAPHPNARSTIYFDAHSAKVLRFDPYEGTSRGYKAYRWLESLHMGYIGGIFGQLVLFTAILAIPVLGVTGLRSWLRRREPTKRAFMKQTA